MAEMGGFDRKKEKERKKRILIGFLEQRRKKKITRVDIRTDQYKNRLLHCKTPRDKWFLRSDGERFEWNSHRNLIEESNVMIYKFSHPFL